MHRQKEGIEEDLRRQKAQADEEIRRKTEELRRKEDELNRAWRERKEGKGGSESGNRPLDPTRLEDSYKILGVEAGLSLGEYKNVYYQLAKQYDPNRVANMAPELWEITNEKSKLIHRAWETIKKNV